MSDFIDRHAAINAIEDMKPYHKDADDIAEMIQNMPSADVQPVRHGKWIEKTVESDCDITEWQSAKCSVCGLYHTTPYMYYFDTFKYCPNCGSFNGTDGEQDE